MLMEVISAHCCEDAMPAKQSWCVSDDARWQFSYEWIHLDYVLGNKKLNLKGNRPTNSFIFFKNHIIGKTSNTNND